jgi:Calcineurin-like phosphoesterase
MINSDATLIDRRAETGAFDIIGDVHGCGDELELLLERLGYSVSVSGTDANRRAQTSAPLKRRAVFVGDLTDRGPRSPDVLRIVMAMVASGQALAVPGNHDVKIWRWLSGRNVSITHGLNASVEQFGTETPAFRDGVKEFLAGLPTYLWLDRGALAVAHAGIRSDMLGRLDGKVGHFCIYGDTDGQKDEQGLSIRYNWAAGDVDAQTFVVYGHVPVLEPAFLNASVCIDTGCCFGAKLTALRWPEREIVSVAAKRIYYPSMRTFGLPAPRA